MRSTLTNSEKSMFRQLISLSLCLLVLVLPAVADGGVRCKEGDKQALLEIKAGLIDEFNHLSSWTATEPETDCCNWRGIRCSNRTGHVVMLDLHVTDFFSEIGNYISLSLLKLRHLSYLDLSHNNFNGNSFPGFNDSIRNLKYLNFLRSSFGGTLSYQFSNLTNLQSLDLSYNFGLGSVYNIRYTPNSIDWLSRFSSIQNLDLSGIDLGRAKDWFQLVKTLPSLKHIKLHGCNLSGNIPEASDPSNASSLETIHFSRNHFTVSVFGWLLNFRSSLVDLELGNNLLDGLIPESIGNMTSLVNLDLSLNQFMGGVPDSFGRLCKLKRLDLSWNSLDVQLPELVGSISGCMEESLEILKLVSNKLRGSLPDISIFSALKELDLSQNQLDGSLPENFSFPSNLVSMVIIGNQLTGSLPDVRMLPFIKEIYVRDNRLNGTLPESLGSLSELEVLDVSGNILKGSISEVHFLNLSKLNRLDLSGNRLSINVSQKWTPAFQLNIIGLDSCQLGPGFPKWIQTQKNCSYLGMSSAGILDAIPDWFWDFSPRLINIDLSSNFLLGKLPDLSLKFPGNFPGLDLSSNMLEGQLPLFPPNVTSLNLSGNNFSGNISVLCRIRSGRFNFLDLSYNDLNGTIPDCLNRWVNIAVLNLANNKFHGIIPVSMGLLVNLKALNLQNNSFHGELPSSLSNCTELEFLDLSDNMLSGNFPAWIGQNLSSLKFLSLKSNQLTGSIPVDLCQMADIQILDLALNNILGRIPGCISNLSAMVQTENLSTIVETIYSSSYEERTNTDTGTNYVNSAIVRWKGTEYLYGTNLGLLRIIDFSSNNLTEEIPGEITSLQGLAALNLSRNGLTGKIPEKIGELKQIQSLDLSSNHLSGEIPSSIAGLTFMSYLNLSNNNLSGRIPPGTQIQGFDASVFSGNIGLCGKPLKNSCQGEDRRVTPTEEDGHDKEDSDENDDEFWKWFCLSLGLGFFVGFLGICVMPLLKPSWRASYSGFLDFLILMLRLSIRSKKKSRS